MTTRPLILIIDDMIENVEVLGEALSGSYDIQFATSGPEGLALLKMRRPDLVLLDIMMPGMSGYEVFDAIKLDPQTRAIPVIFVTAKNNAESETKALNAGAVDFVHKPINTDVVRARVRLHLELEKRREDLKQNMVHLMQTQNHLRVLSMAVEQSPTSVLITGPDGLIEYVNPQFTRETGYSSVEAIGQNPRLLHSGLTPQSTFDDMWATLIQGEPWTGELINRRKSGEVFWEEAHVAPVKDDAGSIIHFVAVKLDVTERKQAHERLAYMAHHDALTGLPNRILFFEHVMQSLAMAKRNANILALMFVDLDRFKVINDTYGHGVGDQVLIEAARRMSDSVRGSDMVGRIGGDEFVVLMCDLTNEGSATTVAEKIRHALNQPFTVAQGTVSISSSIGIAMFPEHGSDEIELARNADYAMYHAKENGRNGIAVYLPGMWAPH